MKGFYRQDENGNLLYAPNAVYGPHGKWSLCNPGEEWGGWHWFASEAQAREELGLPSLDFEQACQEELDYLTEEDIVRIHRALRRSNVDSAIRKEIARDMENEFNRRLQEELQKRLQEIGKGRNI